MSLAQIPQERLAVYKSFQKQTKSFGFKMFLLAKLPSAWFSGVRVVSIDNTNCKVSIPYKWFSQNPFKSTYFACQAMAAELSTGLPASMACDKLSPRVSMLVVDMKAQYSKKATSLTTFECKEVEKIILAVQEAIETGEARTVSTETVGYNEKNEEISRFIFTWSFKQKSK